MSDYKLFHLQVCDVAFIKCIKKADLYLRSSSKQNITKGVLYAVCTVGYVAVLLITSINNTKCISGIYVIVVCYLIYFV